MSASARKSMTALRRAAATVLVALAVLPAAASAQSGPGAPDFRDRFTEEFTADDFCGTGATVQGVENGVFNGWEGDDTLTITLRQKITFTYGDATIVLLNAGRLDVERAEGEFPGPRTDLVVDTGLRAQVRVPGQGAVTLDHGYIEYLVSFDENGDFVDLEVLRDAGGHPDIYGPAFCTAAVEALGLPTA